jgi:hypothetical protein
MNEEKTHLEKFVISFITKDRRERWLNYLLENPEKIMDLRMSRFYGQRNEKTTDYIKKENLANVFGNDFDKVKGLYFDEFDGVTEFINLSQAIEKGYGREAIFSVKAGELAVFFTHEYEFFLCQNKSL